MNETYALFFVERYIVIVSGALSLLIYGAQTGLHELKVFSRTYHVLFNKKSPLHRY